MAAPSLTLCLFLEKRYWIQQPKPELSCDFIWFLHGTDSMRNMDGGDGRG